jgi:hypothetical protein
MTSEYLLLRRLRLPGIAIVAAIAPFATAMAMDTCSGQVSAAALHPLPNPTVAVLDLFDNSARSLELGSAFTDGMKRGGMRVDGTPTVKAVVTISILGGGGRSRSRYREADRNDWASLGGGVYRAPPDQPNNSILTPASPEQTPPLIVRIELRDAAGRQVDWIATLQCTPRGGDDQRLAFEIGELVGRLGGKRVDSAPF